MEALPTGTGKMGKFDRTTVSLCVGYSPAQTLILDRKFLHGKSGTIGESVFVTLKYRLSVLSIVLTTGFVIKAVRNTCTD